MQPFVDHIRSEFALAVRLIQKIQMTDQEAFGFASTFPISADRSVWVDAPATKNQSSSAWPVSTTPANMLPPIDLTVSAMAVSMRHAVVVGFCGFSKTSPLSYEVSMVVDEVPTFSGPGTHENISHQDV